MAVLALRHAPPLLALALMWVTCIDICSLTNIYTWDVYQWYLYNYHRYTYEYICKYIIVYTYMDIDMYISVYTYMYLDMYACMYVCICIYIYLHISTCIRAHNDTTSACSCSDVSHLHTYISVRYISMIYVTHVCTHVCASQITSACSCSDVSHLYRYRFLSHIHRYTCLMYVHMNVHMNVVRVYVHMNVVRASCTTSVCLDGYCSTAQGLLDWFEINLGFTKFFFSDWFVCYLFFLVLRSLLALLLSFLDVLHCLPRAVGIPLEAALNHVSRMCLVEHMLITLLCSEYFFDVSRPHTYEYIYIYISIQVCIHTCT